MFGRTVNGSEGVLAEMCTYIPLPFTPQLFRNVCVGKEYASADLRWGLSDSTVVSLELLTVFGAAPLCFYILRQLLEGDPARHYWIVVLCTAELYGG